MEKLLTGMLSLTQAKQLAFEIISSPEPSGSQGELIVYPWSGVRRRPSTFFKHLLLRNRSADESQILCGASLGRGNESLYK